ncbi:MAG: hypothetical protein AAF726_13510 [Planctomycetota bacterium]
MRLSTALLPLSLLSLAACGGNSSAADVDIAELVQTGKFEAAVSAAEAQMATIEKGTEAHKDLVLNYASALAESDSEKARNEFLGFATEHTDLVTPKDFKFVVSQLRTHDQYLHAIDVMDAGKKRWPNDAEMDKTVEALKQDIAASGNSAAAAKMAGLGYM